MAGIVRANHHLDVFFAARQFSQGALHKLQNVHGTVAQFFSQHAGTDAGHQRCQHFRQLLITLFQAAVQGGGNALQPGNHQIGVSLGFQAPGFVALLHAFVITGLPAFGKSGVVTFLAAGLKAFFMTLLTAFHQALFQAVVVGFAADIFQFFGSRE